MSNFKSAAVLVLCACALSASACGGDDDEESGLGSSGVEGSKRLDALSNDERAKICDFMAAKVGGYDGAIECDADISLESPYPTQAECVADAPATCAATVSQLEQCTKDQSCTNLLPSSCAPVFACLL